MTIDEERDLTYRPGREGVTKLLGELEGAVMEVLWRLETATVREVHKALQTRSRRPAYTTVMTVMTRLFEKGLLGREPEGNAYRYAPSASQEDFLAQASRQVFSSLVEDLASAPVMSSFVGRLGKKELEALEELAEVVEAERKRRTGKKRS